MSIENRVYNFSAGPSTIPLSVLKKAQEFLLALPGAGASVLEISHRSKTFDEIFHTLQSNIRKLLSLSDDFELLFLQGGATLQFSMIPINFLRASTKNADYIVTGEWSKKAVKEAQREGRVQIAWDGSDSNYTHTPSQEALVLSPDPAYVHFTSNETIQGVQFHETPQIGDAPLICDASSDFLCRPILVNKYSLIYAGAQKNLGPAGLTIVIIHKGLLDRVPKDQHSSLDYRLQAEKQSLYNTPPVFSIYVSMLVTQWLIEEFGGLEKVAARNQEKANLLYDVIDQSDGFYRGHARKESRSMMNVTWKISDESLEKKFIEDARQSGLCELKGHRSVGGIRASIYNAMSLEGVQALHDFMLDFQNRYA